MKLQLLCYCKNLGRIPPYVMQKLETAVSRGYYCMSHDRCQLHGQSVTSPANWLYFSVLLASGEPDILILHWQGIARWAQCVHRLVCSKSRWIYRDLLNIGFATVPSAFGGHKRPAAVQQKNRLPETWRHADHLYPYTPSVKFSLLVFVLFWSNSLPVEGYHGYSHTENGGGGAVHGHNYSSIILSKRFNRTIIRFLFVALWCPVSSLSDTMTRLAWLLLKSTIMYLSICKTHLWTKQFWSYFLV